MSYENTNRRLLTLFIAGVCGIAGCKERAPNAPSPPAKTISRRTVDQVCQSAAQLMSVERSKVNAETTLADLNADELDFVELVMELEEEFDIHIPDETADRMLGGDNWQQGRKNITMTKIAEAIDAIKQRPATGR